jgi:hypothetical protein
MFELSEQMNIPPNASFISPAVKRFPPPSHIVVEMLTFFVTGAPPEQYYSSDNRRGRLICLPVLDFRGESFSVMV